MIYINKVKGTWHKISNIFSVEYLIDFLNNHWISIAMFEFIFIFEDPFLAKDTFWVGLISLSSPYLYKIYIPLFINDKLLVKILGFSSMILILVLFRDNPISNVTNVTLKYIMWTLLFNFIFGLCLQTSLTVIFNKLQGILSNLVKILFLFIIYIILLFIALYHNNIINFVINYIIPNMK